MGAGSLAGTLGSLMSMQFLALGGLLLSTLIVLGVTYLSVRRFRTRRSGQAFRNLYLQRLLRTSAWAVGTYALWFILISPILYLVLRNVFHLHI